MSPFAKFRKAGEPAIREMLVQGRVQALEKTLALMDSQLALHPSLALQEQRRKIEQLLERARRGLPPN